MFKERKIKKLLKKASKQGLNSAIMTYNKILELDDSLAAVYNYIGLCYFELVDYENAQKYFFLSIEKFSDEFKSEYEVYYNLAFTFQSSSKNEEAEKYYKISMNLNKEYKFTYKNYAYLLFQEKRYKEALDMFEKYNSFGEEAEVYNNIGIINEELANKSKAIKSYEKSIEIDETYALAYNNLGVLYLNDKKYNDASKLFDDAIKFDSTLVDAYNNLASIFVLDKKYNAAISLYTKALKVSPNHLIILINLAKLYSYLKDKNNMILTLKKTLKLGYQIEKILVIEEFKSFNNLENELRD